jgi:hypothetical protein
MYLKAITSFCTTQKEHHKVTAAHKIVHQSYQQVLEFGRSKIQHGFLRKLRGVRRAIGLVAENKIGIFVPKDEIVVMNFKAQGRVPQNFLGKFVRFFVTLRCFCTVVIHRKYVLYDLYSC